MGNLGSGLQFEGQVKPDAITVDSYEGALFAQRVTTIPTNMKQRASFNANGNAAYVGYAPKGLPESSDGWMIHKFTYDASGRCTAIDVDYGNWTGRTGYTYA